MGKIAPTDGPEEVKKALKKKRTKARWTEDRKSEAKAKDAATEGDKVKKTKRKKGKGKGKDKKKKEQPEGHVHESAGQGKALKYLEKWDTDHDSWKFEKCRQIWLLQNCYDLAKIPDARFDTLLKYMASIRGKMGSRRWSPRGPSSRRTTLGRRRWRRASRRPTSSWRGRRRGSRRRWCRGRTMWWRCCVELR